MRDVLTRFICIASLAVASFGCATTPAPRGAEPIAAENEAFLDDLQARTFRWFWDWTNPTNGLVPDRAPSVPFSSIAAVGFGLTAYPVGVERGYVTREEAAERTVNTLRFFWNAPQGEDAAGMTGHRGFFYHFLNMEDGTRFQTNELSTIDTALLIGGVLMAMEYFEQQNAVEGEIRALADSLYRRVEWPWFQERHPLISMAWRPEGNRNSDPVTNKSRSDYRGYNEAMILYVLALGSPTHPIEPEVWDAYTSTYVWDDFYGYEHVNFAPLFGHQYSHVWIDFRGIQDDYMRERGIDYFENSRRATLSQRAYGIDNPRGFRDYSGDIWGWTASDGPGGGRLPVNGDSVQFFTYRARGVAATEIVDDGTIVPTATGGSIPFAPEETIAALQNIRARYGNLVYDEHGFVDAFNPTFRFPDRHTQRGAVDPEHGWFDDDKLGIDQGPIVLMAENYRTGLIWKYMRGNPYIIRGLCRAGFSGGWLQCS